MVNIKHAIKFALYDLKKWKRNPRIIIAFILLLLLCLTLTDKYVSYAKSMGMAIQAFEPFIVVFTGKYTLIYLSLLILLVFNDVPFLENGLPYYLIRSNRKSWVIGQLIYIAIASLIIITFSLLVCLLSGFHEAFAGNMWSEAAVFISNGGALDNMEPFSMALLVNSLPYTATANIYGLTLLYTLLIGCILYAANLIRSKYAGTLIVGILIFIGYISAIRWLGSKFAWFSILAHANYTTHSFYKTDTLPRVSDSYAIFVFLIFALSIISYRKSRKYQFSFSGDQL